MTLPHLANKEVPKDTSEKKQLVMEAIRKDLPLAHAWFNTALIGRHLSEKPLEPLGKQIARICAATGLRTLVEEHLAKLHGQPLKIAFANCCDVWIMTPEEYNNFDHLSFQMQTQNGELNHADC